MSIVVVKEDDDEHHMLAYMGMQSTQEKKDYQRLKEKQ